MTKIIGHRGAAAFALENTFESFEAAISQKADMIEIDVQQTRDKKLVVFHDNILDKLTNGNGFIKDRDLEDIKKLLLNDNTRIIELSDFINFIKKYPVGCFFEVKGEDIAGDTYNEVRDHLALEDFVIGSFFHKQVEDLKTNHPEVQTSILFEGYPTDLKKYLEKVKADFISIGFESVSDQLAKDIHQSGKKIIFWTIDNETEFIKALTYQPFGIISNKPGYLKSLMKNKPGTS